MAVNDTLLFQRRIRYQFESFCKKVIRNERFDYMQQLQRHTEREMHFSELSCDYLEGICSRDSWPGKEYVFLVYGYHVPIQNELLIEALLNIAPEERSILILYYCLGLKDPEIAQLLHTSRSRVQRLRSRAFDQLQSEMRR